MEYTNERTCSTDETARPSALTPLLSWCCPAVAVQKKSKALCSDVSRMQHVSTKKQNHTLHATKARDVCWPRNIAVYGGHCSRNCWYYKVGNRLMDSIIRLLIHWLIDLLINDWLVNSRKKNEIKPLTSKCYAWWCVTTFCPMFKTVVIFSQGSEPPQLQSVEPTYARSKNIAVYRGDCWRNCLYYKVGNRLMGSIISSLIHWLIY